MNKEKFILKQPKEKKKVHFKSTNISPLQRSNGVSDGGNSREKFEEISTFNDDFSKRLPSRPLASTKSKKRKKKKMITRADIELDLDLD
ncbi:hypothetical protein GLOIN_2v1763033 [Rhizophagus irregularis DAOM 181602=DAOM 197198]|nr:hypothetical protein GLOIN_2v1763033 [Rhizophagus irregularis DAOM 181602=DAOM 197198]